MTSRPDDASAEQPAEGAHEPIDAASTADDAAPPPVGAPPVEQRAVEQAESAETEADDERERPVLVERDDVEVRARLVPRYGRFMVLGAILGLAGGYLWSRLGSSGPLLGVGPVIDTSAMVPFLMAVGALAGIVLGAVLAIVLDRLVGRRRRTLTAERTRHHRADERD